MTITFADHDEMVKWAEDFLRAQGRRIELGEQAGPWITVKEFREQYAPHLSSPGLTRRMQSPECPKFQKRYGKNGHRIVKLRATPELIAWISRPLTPTNFPKK